MEMIKLKLGWDNILLKNKCNCKECREQKHIPCGKYSAKQNIKEINKLIISGEAIIED